MIANAHDWKKPVRYDRAMPELIDGRVVRQFTQELLWK